MVIVLSALMMIGLMLLVNRTRLGRAMRATAENPRVAGLMGVNPNFVIAMTFAIGAALAALAGVMLAATYGVAHFYMGFLPGPEGVHRRGARRHRQHPGRDARRAAARADRGARRRLHRRTSPGGVLGSHYQDIFAFLILVLVLIFRPSGLLGERVADRA